MGSSEPVNRWKTDNTVAKRSTRKRPTMVYKTLHRKAKNDQQELH